ncbi:hypothetical protein [Vibrio spartinae]|uniref:Uncharacterized protein n=1 Tax=Vibrio spartinae TaxID=1918945 RepID=A0ABX6R259_9VIBR|nr:hypothetical protein [Vibrio spartinae]QMV15473.1 hypothetical protein Vspart_02788 [Vibrio spartinae]
MLATKTLFYLVKIALLYLTVFIGYFLGSKKEGLNGLKFIPEFYPESIDQLSFVDSMFHFIQINHPPKKTIPGEWLGFFGQDARKRRFWTTRNQAKQKRFSGSSFISER